MAGAPAFATANASRPLSDRAGVIVGGFVEEFLHREPLTHSEEQCLARQLLTLSETLLHWSSRVASLLKQLARAEQQASQHPGAAGGGDFWCAENRTYQGGTCLPDACPAVGSHSLSSCKELCAAQRGCGALVYSASNGTCLLKEAAEGGAPDAALVSCVYGGANATSSSSSAPAGRRFLSAAGSSCETLPFREKYLCEKGVSVRNHITHADQEDSQEHVQTGSSMAVASSLRQHSPQIGDSFGMLMATLNQVITPPNNTGRPCLRGNASVIHDVGEHLRNLSYIGGHLTANGADILAELANALAAFERGKYRTFGKELGAAARKVVLSNASGTPVLPEGPPSDDMVLQMMAGFLSGFFGDGIVLHVASKRGGLGTFINLKECVRRNVEYFRTVWDAACIFFAQIALHGKGIWKNTEAVAALVIGLPDALRTCSLGPEKLKLIEHAAEHLSQMTLHVNVLDHKPGDHIVVPDVVAVAADDWRARRWQKFAWDLGSLMQGMVVEVLPQEYDAALGRHALGEERASPSSMFFFGTAVLLLLLTLATLIGIAGVVRRRRGGTWPAQPSARDCRHSEVGAYIRDNPGQQEADAAPLMGEC